MPDTNASQALERMDDAFPNSAAAAGADLQLVFVPDSGDVTASGTVSAISAVLADAANLPGVESVSDPYNAQQPYLSPKLDVAVSTIHYGELSEEQQEKYYSAALELLKSAPADLGIELGGNLVPLGAPAPGIGEAVGVIMALVVLGLTFGSLLAAGVNLLLAVFGVGVGLVGVLAYGALTPIGDNTIILAAMIGLAVGIDYALFVISRFRLELRKGSSVPDAVTRAAGTAGTAVLFAGLTVIVALVGLVVVNIPVITEMGIAAAFAVLVDVLIALTLLPAVLGLLGRRMLSTRQRVALDRGEFLEEGGRQRRGLIRGWSSLTVKRPIISAVAGIAVLVVIALPMFQMKTALSVPGGADPDSTERAAYTEILDAFGGVQSPLIVLAEGDEVAARAAAVVNGLSEMTGVQQVVPAELSSTGEMARIIVIPEAGPIDQQTKDLVHAIRDDADSYDGVHLEVTGETAIGIDQDAQLNAALIEYLIIIAVISVLLMVLLFRSILIPLIATAGYLLSVGAAFGASVAVFQWGWLDALIPAPQGDPMLSLLPIILVGVLFGLAMDYQVFLVSRIQELHKKGMDPKAAIREGFARSAPVVIAAASIMVVVFGGFATSEFSVGASIAFGLMVGVAADAFIVRLVLMPALLSLLGRAAWWMPAWLDRAMPSVDVEGHALDVAEDDAPRQVGSGELSKVG
nr:MMPL family transporter [Agromyces seonyuensis]